MEKTRLNIAPETGAPEAAPEAGAAEEIEQMIERVVAQRLAEAMRKLEARAARPANAGGEAGGERGAEDVRAREEELARREAELDRRELRAWTVDELTARGLPRELAQVVDCGDAERCRIAVDALEKAFREAVQRGVDERIGKGTPLPRSGGAQAGMTQKLRMAAGLND